MMYSGGSTALQGMLGQYNQAKRNSIPQSTQPTALSGIGMWNKWGEDRLQSGLTDAMTGNMNVQQHADLGTSTFGKKQSNPWEAFVATPAEQQAMEQGQQNSFMSGYRPQARGINMSLW